jgi:hypothetical protein
MLAKIAGEYSRTRLANHGKRRLESHEKNLLAAVLPELRDRELEKQIETDSIKNELVAGDQYDEEQNTKKKSMTTKARKTN